MPDYSYVCNICDHSFDVFHSMNDKPIIICPVCKSKKIGRDYSTCGIIIKSGHAERFVHDSMKRNGEIKRELKESYGVESTVPIQNVGLEEIYSNVKKSGSLIKEQLQESKEISDKRLSKKHKEWRREALKRTPQRAKEKKERKAKEESAKRSIRL